MIGGKSKAIACDVSALKGVVTVDQKKTDKRRGRICASPTPYVGTVNMA